MHPRWVTKKFTSHSGKQWSEKVIDEHLDNGNFGLKVHVTEATRIGEPDSHGYRVIESDWRSNCCHCTKTEILTEKRKTKLPFGR